MIHLKFIYYAKRYMKQKCLRSVSPLPMDRILDLLFMGGNNVLDHVWVGSVQAGNTSERKLAPEWLWHVGRVCACPSLDLMGIVGFAFSSPCKQ